MQLTDVLHMQKTQTIVISPINTTRSFERKNHNPMVLWVRVHNTPCYLSYFVFSSTRPLGGIPKQPLLLKCHTQEILMEDIKQYFESLEQSFKKLVVSYEEETNATLGQAEQGLSPIRQLRQKNLQIFNHLQELFKKSIYLKKKGD